MNKICLNCKKEYSTYNKESKYCCKSCYALHQRIWERTPSYSEGKKNIGFTGRKHSKITIEKIRMSCLGKGRPKGDEVVVVCKECGKEFKKPKRYKNKDKHFCSQDCWHKWNKGENHICFDETLQRDYIGFTEELKQTIRLRDNVCQICGIEKNSDNRALSVHHIDCDKHNPNPTNLICLCESCHTKVHNNIKEWTGYLTRAIEEKYYE